MFLMWIVPLLLIGLVVYAVSGIRHMTDNDAPTPEQKESLDLVHLVKVLHSEAIFVLDVGGYIGDSTRREIILATMLNKFVYYLSNEAHVKYLLKRREPTSGQGPIAFVQRENYDT